MSWKYYTETKFFVQKILYKLRKLEIYRTAKFLTLIKIEFTQFLSRLCTYIWGINSLKNYSAVIRSG